MFIEQIPQVVRWFFSPVLWRKDPGRKVIYLTFDDGPTEENTRWILDQLDARGIKATFFCIGRNVRQHPDLYEEIRKRGHRTGLHGYDHKRGLYKDESAFADDLRMAEQYVQSDLFRPPHGHLKFSQIRELSKKFTIVLWDVITRDYNASLKPEQIYRIAVRYGRNGSIVVFHDSVKARANMTYAFPKAVDYWLSKGYKFETL